MSAEVVAELRALLSGMPVDVPGSSRHHRGDVTVRIIARHRDDRVDVHVHVLGPVVEPSEILVWLEPQPPDGARRQAEPKTAGHWIARDVEPGVWTMQIDEGMPADEGEQENNDTEQPNPDGWPSPAIDDLDPRRRITALDVLAQGPEAAVPRAQLRRGLVDPAPAVRAHTLALLADRRPDDLVDVLLEALVDRAVQVQELASTALAGRLRSHHLERIAGPLVSSEFHAGPTLVDVALGIGGVAAAFGVGLGIASESPLTRAAAVRRLASVSPLGYADVGDRTAAGSISWVTVAPGDDPVEVHLPPTRVVIRRRGSDAVTVTLTAAASPLAGVWIGGATDAGWVVLRPEVDALVLTIDPSVPLLVGGVVPLDAERVGRPEWLPALASTLDRRAPSDPTFRALLDDPGLPQAARALLEGASRNVLAEATAATRRGPVAVNVLGGARTEAGEDRPSFDLPVEAALARLALARLRERVSGSCLWSLDALAAVLDLATLDADLAPDPPTAEVLDALSLLPERAIEERSARLHDAVMPLLDRLDDATVAPRVESLRQKLTSSKELELLTRVPARQFAVGRLAAVGRIIVGPDVHVAGLVPPEPVIDDRRTGNVRRVRITLDSAIGRHYSQVEHLWPAAGHNLDPAEAWPLWYHLAGLVAAWPADGRAGATDREVLAARVLVLQHLVGRGALLADHPPDAPRLWVGHLDGRTPFTAVRMTPELDGPQLTLTAHIAARPAPLVVALGPARTRRSGALATSLAFAHQAPAAAAEVLGALAELGSADADALRGAADRLQEDDGALALDGGVTPSMSAIRIAHLARERAAVEVRRDLQRWTPEDLTGRHDRRTRIDGFVDDLHELDRVLPW